MTSTSRKIISAWVASAFLFTAAQADERPFALVEYVADAPEAGVSGFDYLYDGDKIDLRPGGALVVAYFDRCIVETFEGGIVQFKKGQAKITKDGASKETVRPCQTAALALSSQATTAGATVKRQGEAGGLLSLEAMQEISTPFERPVFIWPKQISEGRVAAITINFLDADNKQEVWKDEANGARFSYPEHAPSLQRGLPYEIIVTFDGRDELKTVFSVDPDLELPGSPLNNVIPLGL